MNSMDNKLYKKTIIWNGDSICAGKIKATIYATGNWATRIAANNDMTYRNYAVGGGTVAENTRRTASGAERYYVSPTLERMQEEYPDADYVIFEGGTNDADLLGNVKRDEKTGLGIIDPQDFSGDYDRETFCGALESVFYRAVKYWKGKKIGYIVAPKMGMKGEALFENRRFYFDKAIEICEKWNIPYIDLWNDSELDPSVSWMYNETKTPEENLLDNTGYYYDGQHLTSKGYDVTTELIEAWLKTL